MSVLKINPAKHPHPRRYRRALGLGLLGSIAGVGLTVFGLYVATLRLQGPALWLTTLILLGPTVVFLSAVGFATYMENLETETYGGSYHEDHEPPTPMGGYKEPAPPG